MAEVLGIGLSHYPPLSGTDAAMSNVLRGALRDPGVPSSHLDPATWPEQMRREWAADEGLAAAAEHRAALVAGFQATRAAIDAFQPDAVLIWGDDQYENFKEDLIPPYAVLAYGDQDVRPWEQAASSSDMVGRENAWGEPGDTTIQVRGRPDIAKHLVSGLLERSVDVAYAYKGLHHPGLAHAFLNAVLYLDYDRTGFPYPVIPFPINCYGRRVISYEGFISRLGDERELDPPSPQPARLMDVGRAVASTLAESPWRVALVASSSWSHAFLCDHTYRLRPDTEADLRLYRALVSGDVQQWRDTSLSSIEHAGQQELLNWFPLLGAMSELGRAQPSWHTFTRTDVFNSNKVFAVYEP